MDPRFRTALWALAGLALAVGISMAAFAVAGGRISEPAGSVRVSPTTDELVPENTPKPSTHPTKSETPSGGGSTTTSTVTTVVTAAPSPSEDHGGTSGSGDGGSHSGSDD